MAVGITRLDKSSELTVILGFETIEEINKLQAAVQAKMGENFQVTESIQVKPKIKIAYGEKGELELK